MGFPEDHIFKDSGLFTPIASIFMDLQANDLTALSELLTFIHPDILDGYLVETDKDEMKTLAKEINHE